MWTPFHRWEHLRARRTPGGGSGRGGGAASNSEGASSSPLASSTSNPTTPVAGGSAPILFDDSAADEGRNGLPASAGQFSRLIAFLNQTAYQGKPLFSFIGATSTGGAADEDTAFGGPLFRQVYAGSNYGAVTEGAAVHYEYSTGSAVAGQGWGLRLNDTEYIRYYNISTPTVAAYPRSIVGDSLTGTRGFTAANSELVVNTKSITPPQLRSGVIWQEPQDIIDPNFVGTYIDSSGVQTGKNAYVNPQLVRQGSPIVGIRSTQPTANDVLQQMRVSMLNTWQYRRGQIGWSMQAPGQNGGVNAILFNTAPTVARYIFNQDYGSGGTAFTAHTPAITMPLLYQAGGRHTQVRVYVFVYAAMNGTTDTGTIAIGNRDSTGSMQSSPISPVTNAPTISGTTFKWYPDAVSATTASLSLSGAPYFMGYCGPNADYDRIALCAKSNGATDSVLIAAFSLIPVGDPF